MEINLNQYLTLEQINKLENQLLIGSEHYAQLVKILLFNALKIKDEYGSLFTDVDMEISGLTVRETEQINQLMDMADLSEEMIKQTMDLLNRNHQESPTRKN